VARDPVILHRTGTWLVIDKPAGWHSVRGRGSEPDVETWLRAAVPACSPLEEGGLVHRLDYPTSGCLLAATDAAARAALREAMSGRGSITIEKQYLALCEGGVPNGGAFELHFSKRHRGSRKMTVATQGNDRSIGRAEWRLRGQVGPHALLDVALQGPGRRHQIRAGLAHLGFPIVGDDLYGSTCSAPTVCLHAAALEVGGVEVRAQDPDWAA